MSVAVEFRNVTKEFGPVRVLHGVDFALQPGRVYGLLALGRVAQLQGGGTT